jgi:hypothetical protein
MKLNNRNWYYITMKKNLLLLGLIPIVTIAGIRLWIGGLPDITGSSKTEIAIKGLTACIGNDGIWADPTRYRYQDWTRDLSLALQPAVSKLPNGEKMVEQHLINLAARQRDDGKIPIVFIDSGLKGHTAFIWDKIGRSIKSRKISFMLRRYLQGELGNLTPGTKDSELHFIRAILNSSPELQDKLRDPMEKAFTYIENNLLNENSLMEGADWRDTIDALLANKALLTNNAMLYGVYKKMGLPHLADNLRMNMSNREGGLLVDYPGATRPDPLGLALGVLEGLITEEYYDEVINLWRSVDSAYGVTIQCEHNPQNEEEKIVIKRTKGIVNWPFINHYTILAAKYMNTPKSITFAEEQKNKANRLGFYEWYDPSTGKGYGAYLQGWSMAMYLATNWR